MSRNGTELKRRRHGGEVTGAVAYCRMRETGGGVASFSTSNRVFFGMVRCRRELGSVKEARPVLMGAESIPIGGQTEERDRSKRGRKERREKMMGKGERKRKIFNFSITVFQSKMETFRAIEDSGKMVVVHDRKVDLPWL